MTTVVLVIHLLLTLALIGVVLLQRSEGGGLGIGGGGGGGMGSFMSARGTANLLTRTTALLATGFICTSILLSILAGVGGESGSIIDDLPVVAPGAGQSDSAPTSVPTD